MQEPPMNFAIPSLEALQADPAAPATAEAPGGATSKVGAVLQQQLNTLMAIEGVVMVGEGRDAIGRDAIVIGVKDHHHLKALPRTVDDIPVVGMVIGVVDALSGPGTPR